MLTGLATLSDGCRLFYRVDGPPDAPVLMLSNSLGTRLEMWAPQMERLAERYRVLRYDSRGHGRSDCPAGDYSIARLGDDAVQLLDLLGLDRVRFAGLSKGGMIGQWLGINAGLRLERLALCNTAAFMGPPAAWQTRIDLVCAQGMAPLVPAVVERWFTPRFRADSPESVAPIAAMLQETNPAGYAACCAAIRDMDQRGGLAMIRVPTLVIGGTEDPATPPEKSFELAQGIAGSRLVMLDAAHLSNIEQAERFTASLLTFME